MDIDKIASHLTDDPDVISESLEDDAKEMVDRINAGALDVGTARKLFQQEISNYQWSNHEIDRVIDFIKMFYPLDRDIFVGGWRPHSAVSPPQPAPAQKPAAPPKMSPQKLVAMLNNNTIFDFTTPISETGQWYGRHYRATLTSPEEFPEWEQRLDDSYGGWYIGDYGDDLVGTIRDEKGEFANLGISIQDLHNRVQWGDYYIIEKLHAHYPPKDEEPDDEDRAWRLDIDFTIADVPLGKPPAFWGSSVREIYVVTEPRDAIYDEKNDEIEIIADVVGITEYEGTSASSGDFPVLMGDNVGMWIRKEDLHTAIPPKSWEWRSGV